MSVRHPNKELYLLEVTEITSDAYVAAGIPKSNAEIGEIAEIWMDSLFGYVPTELLRSAYNRADRQHETVFPVNVHEVKAAYKQIENEASEERMRQRITDTANSVTVNSPHFRPCNVCFGCGFREETRRFDGLDHKGVVKCYGCNYWELYKQKNNL